jgi:nucleotide-binding universal stress UspA family protein
MHLLIPFDIVPIDSLVPQSAFGVAPVSERAIRYAFDVYGKTGALRVTAVHFATDTIDLEENMGAAQMRTIADEMGVDADVTIHSVQDVGSMAELREEILEFVAGSDVETVVMGYEESSFDEAVFSGSTPERLLEERDVPVVLVP